MATDLVSTKYPVNKKEIKFISASLQDNVLQLQERSKSISPYKGMEAY